MKKVTIYTDGACSGNPGPGGWASILLFGNAEKCLSGFEPETTNNRMELMAAIMGLDALKENCEVTLYSDSAYLVGAFAKGWIVKWKENGWVKSDKDPVKNIDLWECLCALDRKHKIQWIKVKGHADNEYNNRCDRMAVEEIKKNVKPEAAFVLEERDIDDFEEVTLKSEQLLEGRVFNVDRLTVEMPDGQHATRDVIRHMGAAAVIPLDGDDIYMVRQYRKAAEKLSLEVPAGKIDNGEDPLETARRELKEETGLQAEKLLYLNGLYPSFAISDEIIHLFLATGLTEGESNLDEGEFLAVEKVPVKALREMILDGTIQDMKTIAAVFYAEKYMKEK